MLTGGTCCCCCCCVSSSSSSETSVLDSGAEDTNNLVLGESLLTLCIVVMVVPVHLVVHDNDDGGMENPETPWFGLANTNKIVQSDSNHAILFAGIFLLKW